MRLRTAVALTCLLVPCLAQAGASYSLTPIDIGNPAWSLVPLSINNRGEVAGFIRRGRPGTPVIPDRPFFWSGTGPARELSVPAGTTGSAFAYRVNNLGQAVGRIGDDNVIWSPDGTVRTVAPPPGFPSAGPAIDVDDAGTILTYGFRQHADGTVEELSGFTGVAQNEVGAVLGQGAEGPVVRERDGTVRSLSITGYGFGHGHDVNDAGWVTGVVGTDDVVSLATWRPDGTLIVGATGIRDHYGAEGLGINSRGEVVGFAFNRAAYWTEADGLVDLQTRLDASGAGWTVDSARGLNDAGQIIATAYRAGDDVYHSWAVLLTPVPEPGAALACAVVFAAMATRRRRGN